MHPQLCHKATFVDVDYPTLIKKKREIVVNTDPLCEALDDLDTLSPQDAILIRSLAYLALGCDLKQIDNITKLLEDELHIKDCSVLFIAEVALTYMDPEDADCVIKWASQFDDGTFKHLSFRMNGTVLVRANSRAASFCLLEQHLPSGPDHPFAKTMLDHFKKLRSPLRVLSRYPEIRDQRNRFLTNGWFKANVTDLWSLWSHDGFLNSDERRALDFIEPFDEWEELALFGGHYFLLIATTKPDNDRHEALFPAPAANNVGPSLNRSDAKLICKPHQNGQRFRRFGAAIIIEKEEKWPDIIAYHGGIGQKSRLATCDIYTDINLSDQFKGPPTDALMNHTITHHRNSRYLFVGGRSSPDKARESCWLQDNGHWQEADNLIPGRYRHCAVEARPQISSSRSRTRVNGVLVFGGKTSSSDVLGDWMFWDRENGWQAIPATPETPEPRFGASMLSLPKMKRPCGYLTGGMRADGTVIKDLWKWDLVFKDSLKIVCTNLTKYLDKAQVTSIFGRFGAALVKSEWGVLLLGGITNGLPLRQEDEALVFENKPEDVDAYIFSRLHLDVNGPRPLLVGFGAAAVQDHSVVVLGGGATCFSFGTYWNAGCYTLTNQEETYKAPWHIDEYNTQSGVTDPGKESSTASAVPHRGIAADSSLPGTEECPNPPTSPQPIASVKITKTSIASSADFDKIIGQAHPVILEHISLGSCTADWNSGYLKEKIGPNRPVIVHSSPSKHMNFQSKNFSYVTMPFGQFMDSIESGAKLYLRALSSSKPAKQATTLQEDYPEIAPDFCIPPELELVKSRMHSSPLRISGSVSMWLHYDVMANVLCQVKGTKRLILYPPNDVRSLNLAPGASSSEINVFTADVSTHPSLAHTHPHEAMLHPGDVLFIPAFWLHAAAPTEGMSIAVNVFFRNLDKGYAAGRDVYGNRDLEAYERGRQDINKIINSFGELPHDIRSFYLQRLSDEFQGRVGSVT